MRRVLLLICLATFGFVNPLLAQGEQTGSITGRLTSSDTLALPGATITVSSPALQGSRSVTADIDGVYLLPGLPPGEYIVKFDVAGFEPSERRVTVVLGSALELNHTLAPAGVHETVNVNAGSISPASLPSGAFNLKVEKTNLLSVGRTPMQLAELTLTGPNFGKATSTASYPRPMPGMDGGRTFIGAFGFRF